MSMYNNYPNSTMPQEMGWDDTINREEQEYILIPEGDYPCQIVNLEKTRHEPRPGGKIPACNKAILTVRVADPATGAPVDLNYNLYLHTSQEWKLCEFFMAIGQKRKGEPLRMNWGLVVGSTATCHVSQSEGRRRDNTTFPRNEITRFYPKEDQPAQQPGGFIPGRF